MAGARLQRKQGFRYPGHVGPEPLRPFGKPQRDFGLALAQRQGEKTAQPDESGIRPLRQGREVAARDSLVALALRCFGREQQGHRRALE